MGGIIEGKFSRKKFETIYLTYTDFYEKIEQAYKKAKKNYLF
jgi:hypothetical protein